MSDDVFAPARMRPGNNAERVRACPRTRDLMALLISRLSRCGRLSAERTRWRKSRVSRSAYRARKTAIPRSRMELIGLPRALSLVSLRPSPRPSAERQTTLGRAPAEARRPYRDTNRLIGVACASVKPRALHHGVASGDPLVAAATTSRRCERCSDTCGDEATQICAQIRPARSSCLRGGVLRGFPELPPEASPRYGDVEVHRLVSAGVETEPRSQARCAPLPRRSIAPGRPAPWRGSR